MVSSRSTSRHHDLPLRIDDILQYYLHDLPLPHIVLVAFLAQQCHILHICHSLIQMVALMLNRLRNRAGELLLLPGLPRIHHASSRSSPVVKVLFFRFLNMRSSDKKYYRQSPRILVPNVTLRRSASIRFMPEDQRYVFAYSIQIRSTHHHSILYLIRLLYHKG